MVILFLLLTPFSFVKLLKKNYWWGVTVLKNIESAAAILNVRNPPHPPPPHPTTTLQKRWIGPRTLNTALRALLFAATNEVPIIK